MTLPQITLHIGFSTDKFSRSIERLRIALQKLGQALSPTNLPHGARRMDAQQFVKHWKKKRNKPSTDFEKRVKARQKYMKRMHKKIERNEVQLPVNFQYHQQPLYWLKHPSQR